MRVVTSHFESFGFPLVSDPSVIPDDDSTLFVCSGMQRVRRRFHPPDGGKYGSLQSCLPTNDLDLVGDGSHLTHFQMLGNFSFGGNDYELSVELWHRILTDLGVRADEVHCHPGRPDHARIWTRRGYCVVPDGECHWSDGTIGGHCCELYVGGLEIGNLVNPLGHSTDVGFGWERLLQVVEGRRRADQTSLFRATGTSRPPGGGKPSASCRRSCPRFPAITRDDRPARRHRTGPRTTFEIVLYRSRGDGLSDTEMANSFAPGADSSTRSRITPSAFSSHPSIGLTAWFGVPGKEISQR
jgi:hypothetical protein